MQTSCFSLNFNKTIFNKKEIEIVIKTIISSCPLDIKRTTKKPIFLASSFYLTVCFLLSFSLWKASYQHILFFIFCSIFLKTTRENRENKTQNSEVKDRYPTSSKSWDQKLRKKIAWKRIVYNHELSYNF